MKNYIKSVVALTVICAVVAMLLAVTNFITAPIIEENASAQANDALAIVLPGGEGFTPVDLSTYELPATVTEAYTEAGGGCVVKLTVAGYGPDMVTMCGVNAAGEITGATCLSSNETLGYEKTYGDSAIGYKKSRFKKMASGIFWMTDTPDVPHSVKGAPKGTVRPAVWAKFKSKQTGQIFYFYATHLVLGSMHNDGGTEYNATHFVRVAQDRFEPKYPSFVVGDFNAGVTTAPQAYNIMTSGRWNDTFDYMKASGMQLLPEDLQCGTTPYNDESASRKDVIDHIMFYKAEPLKYWVDRRKFPTADGTLHFPSDHYPIIAEFKLN